MNHVKLGRTGLEVSRLCLGCMTYGKEPAGKQHAGWALDEEASRPFIARAIELGINFFDTADAYGLGASEEILGRALRDFARRDEVVIATKVFAPMRPGPNGGGLSRKHLMSAIDASLKRLGTDHVDLYQIHRWDAKTPIEETLEALHDIVKAGKALHIGASSMHAWQFAKALRASERHGWTRFASMQPQYNLVYREEEREMLPMCRDEGIGVIPWSPLARGFLAGNRKAEGGGETARANGDAFARQMYFRPDDFEVQQRLVEVAADLGVPPMRVALAWVGSRPGITAPIVGATKLSHLDDAVAAIDLTLSDADVARLEAPYKPHPVLGHS